MASCYWAQPTQLHPWYKLDTLKRKHPPILPRSSSPSSMDEYDSDPRAKRQRRTTPEQTRSTKRKLQSPPQSPIESSESSDSSRSNDPRLFKRQRCTTLERGIESLSLTAVPPPTQGQTQALAPSALASISTPLTQSTPRLSTPVLPPLAAPLVSAFHVHRRHEHHVHPDFTNSRWPDMSYSSTTTTTAPNSRPISSPPPPFSTSTSITSSSSVPTLTVDADAITDVKMHASSWYEPEKDRIVVTDLDVSSDDEADVVDEAPKLPRSVLQALLRGPKRGDPPLPGRLSPPVLPRLALQPQDPPSLLHLDPGSLFEPGLDEAMVVE